MKITVLQIVSLTIVVLSLGSLSAQQQQALHADARKKIAASAQPMTPAAPDPGEQKFQANCGRCHNPPEQLSPRITGTVLRHMRVRALLSAQDERDILKYLAP